MVPQPAAPMHTPTTYTYQIVLESSNQGRWDI